MSSSSGPANAHSTPSTKSPFTWIRQKSSSSCLRIDRRRLRDIGTSPLYAIKEYRRKHAIPPDPANILGVLSLVSGR